MSNIRSDRYAQTLASMIRMETISRREGEPADKFHAFHALLRELFPNLFRKCFFEDFDGSFLLRWEGTTREEPILFMNHHDVVEAPGEWKHPPFSGTIADGKLWGRGTLDTKAGCW